MPVINSDAEENDVQTVHQAQIGANVGAASMKSVTRRSIREHCRTNFTQTCRCG